MNYRFIRLVAGLVLAFFTALAAFADTTITVLTPVSIVAANAGGGQDASVSRLVGPARFILTSLNTAGTNPTLAAKLQGSEAAARGYNYQTTGTTDNKLRSGASTNTKLSLKFTQSGAAQVKRVALRLKNNGTIAAGKILTLAIQSDNAGSPSNTALGTSANVDINTSLTASYGWITFTFTNPVDLADATVYHFVLSGDYTADTTNCVTWHSATVASGGTRETSTDGTTWAAASSTESLLAYADQYSFSDITGGGFTSLSTAGTASVQTVELNGVYLPPYVRVYTTIGGTSSPAWTTAVVCSARRAFEQ